jgi:alpha-glucosidase (family GH31 glycosyl hydrolase)
MYYGHMDSSDAFKAKDQYFFGSELLVAPVLKPIDEQTGFATQRIWFPAGDWFNFFTGQKMTGGRWHTVQAALEEIPVFARAGGIIPLGPRVNWGGTENPAELDIYVFPGTDNSFELYEDDGETTDYQRDKYAITRFILEQDSFIIQSVSGATGLVPSRRTYRVHLRGVEASTSASLSGKYDPATRTLSLDPVTLKPTDAFQIQFWS